MKKSLILCSLMMFAIINVTAQFAINEDGAAPDASAALDIAYTTKGVLLPRMTATQRQAIASPATGLIIFQNDSPSGFWYYNGSAWELLTANDGTGTANYVTKWTSSGTLGTSIMYDNGTGVGIGTTNIWDKISFPNNGSGLSWGNNYSRIYDSLQLHIMTDDHMYFDDRESGTRMYINTDNGRVGIGTTSPSTSLEVNGVTRSRTTTGSAAASGQFQSIAGGTAQGQHAVYSFYPTFQNTGDNTPRRAADMLAGFNNGAWSNEYLAFHVGTNGTPNDNFALNVERMRITGGGNIAIGTTSPASSAALDISSSTKGFLPPRMRAEQMVAISSPATGLMVYNTSMNKPNYWDGSEWRVFDGTFNIGQSYAGGIIFWIDGSGEHGLLMASVNQSEGAAWGCQGTSISTSDAIGQGQSNTNNIVAGCSTSGIAARICNDLDLNGYSDWYLPSVGELIQMWQTSGNIGGWTTGYYWSSSQNDANNGKALYFYGTSNGEVSNLLKSQSYVVRCIRNF